MPPFHTHLRLYCERTGNGLWDEPLNALTSLAFLLTTGLLWRLYKAHRNDGTGQPEAIILIILTIFIGLGSFIFHTFATMWAVLFDVIPIVFFVFFYIYVFARVNLGTTKTQAAILFALLIGINIFYKFSVRRAIDGYVSYLPTFVFLLLLTLYLLMKRHPSAMRMTCAALLAFGSLYFRTVDRSWCAFMPLGTHFIWHVLTAIVIYIVVRELIIFKRVKNLSPATNTVNQI